MPLRDFLPTMTQYLFLDLGFTVDDSCCIQLFIDRWLWLRKLLPIKDSMRLAAFFPRGNIVDIRDTLGQGIRDFGREGMSGSMPA